jgi:diguanylate cyclase (GGDEF)-like protein
MSKRPLEMQETELEILRIAAAQVGAELDLSSRQRRIRVLTYEDTITGLPNRQCLLDWLDERPAVSCLLLIDVRRFKDINDLHGHLVGDAILYAVAERLRSRLGERGFLARLSGNEYVMVPADDWSETIEGYAREIGCWFLEPVISGASRFQIDVTIGAACGREVAGVGTVNFSAELLRRAGVGLAEAKTSGVPFMLFNLAMVDSLNHRQRIYEKLLTALRDHRLSLNFQPQIDLETGNLSGAEVLCRWHDSELGWVSPTQFIPLAEERGLMAELGDWVLMKTRQQLDEWQARGVPFQGKLSVNISTRQLESADFPDRLAAMFSGRSASELVLELTETSMMRAPETNLRQMSQLKDRGFAWAVDDFGTGYSSLAYLTRMNAGYLKIDRSFVSRVPNSHHDEAVIRTIVAMAESLGMELIAEGIETGEQLNYLRSIGCRFGQGFFISRPLTPDAFADQWLRAK